MYSKLQKFISFLLIFILLSSFSFRLPFIGLLSYTFAKEIPFYNIVSIIVEENIYPGIKNELERYSKDIQGVLENTRVVILPTPKETSPFNIASLNEALFFEGVKSINKNTTFESKLIGTVIVGDLKTPLVFNKNNSSKTILPYVDFIDKSYVWDNETKKYNFSNDNINGINAEIWHGVISPNTGNKGKDTISIKNYFSKNHDFYEGTGNFKTSIGILNGNNSEGIPKDYKPFVFYFDQIRESKAIIYENYIGYKQFLENKEDIIYNRFSNELATKLQSGVLSKNNKDISDMISEIDPTFDKSLMSSGPDLTKTPQIQSRHIVKTSTKRMLEIFNQSTLGEFKKNVYNAGRYNGTNKKVNVDIPSFIITTLDTINTEIIKSVTNDFEEKIDKLVKNGLSRNIALPTNINYTSGCNTYYTNFLYGLQASKITKAKDCSIYRGSMSSSGTLVEANRGLNVRKIQADTGICSSYIRTSGGQISGGITGYWGGNSPINLMGNVSGGVLNIGKHDLKGGIVKVFDIAGSKEINDPSKIADPRNCFNNNFLLTYKEKYKKHHGCEIRYRVPINGQSAHNWSCNTTNSKYNFNKSFDTNYKNPSGDIILDGKRVAGGGDSNFYYKRISSYIEHKSPTSDELGNEVNSMVTPSLPIDKDRYVDFISAKGQYEKIYYPYLFRIDTPGTKFNSDNIKNILKTYLDKKSLEVNNTINSSNPSSLGGKNLNIYNLLKTGSFPKNNIDFYTFLENKPDKNYKVDGELKKASYIDTIALALYWNNLNSISAKYKFIFENYLSDEVLSNTFDFHLSKNKKLYEISYLGAPGDAQNMYIKLDPEIKSDNPYADIISKNSLINNQLLGANVAYDNMNNSNNGASSQFKCVPPEGVPIFEWFPAVVCWLGNLLPPTISISGGSCGSTVLGGDLLNPIDFFSEEEKKEILACKGDINKNGVNDCIENKLKSGSLNLSTDSGKYYYNRNGRLKAEIKDKKGNIVKLDNNTYINFIIDKIEVPIKSNSIFNNENKKIIYDYKDLSNNSKKEANKYVYFSSRKIRANSGIANYSFSSKNKDANIYFKAIINVEDNNTNSIISLNSHSILVKIRGDKLFLNSSKIIKTDSGIKIDNLGNTSLVSDKFNLFLSSIDIPTLEKTYKNINDFSNSNEKIILNLENISKGGNKLDIEFPLKLKIIKDSKQILKDLLITKSDLESFKPLLAIDKSGTYNIEILDNSGLKVNKKIDFIPGKPNNLDIKLGANVIENEGNITTNLISIFDNFGNIVSGKFLSIDIKIDGKGLVFEQNNGKDISFKIFEGYKAFRLKSTDIEVDILNKIKFYLKDSNGNILLTKTSNIKTLANINLDIIQESKEIKVGGDKYKFLLEIKDKSGILLSDFNSRAYIVIPSLYGNATSPYVYIKGGKAELEFTTSTVAGKKIPIEFQIEGLNTIYKKNIVINPEKPIKVDISLSKNKIEASTSEYSFVDINLKDRFGNIVFNDSNTLIDIEISSKYKEILTSPILSKKISEGKTNFKIYGTELPGQGFFKIKTTPNISSNFFEVKDSKNTLKIYGVGENIGKIETFYFWNENKMNKTRYNGLYTTLIGAPYGDITKKGYLAGSLIFNKNNRSLIVTSLLNNPYKYQDIINILPEGGVKSSYSTSTLSQDINYSISFDDKNRLYLGVFNQALNTFVGKILFNFDNNVFLKSCIGNEKNFNKCINNNKTTILLKSFNEKYLTYIKNGKLILKTSYGKILLEISKNGEIKRKGSISIELNENNKNKYSVFNIKSGNDIIGILGFKFFNGKINFSRDQSIFNIKKNTIKNSVLGLITTNSYGTRDIVGPNGNIKSIFYNDPFSNKKELDNFYNGNEYSYENFEKEGGLGWKGGNKILLDVSAGSSIGEATKNSMSFSLINIGDPVISLKKIRKNLPKTLIPRNFDSTIGKVITRDEDLVGYKVLDYNNDSRNDIILIKRDKSISLLENKDIPGKFLNKGNVAFLSDLGNKDLILTGDFSGDGYHDIFFVNKAGNPFLLKNIEKKFIRINLKKDFNIKGKIIRAQSFDMDNDNIDDIVILDDFGEINIFYGNNSYNFTKKTIGAGYGIKLDNKSRDDNALIYFEGIQQIEESGIHSNDIEINESLIDKIIFETVSYAGIKKVANSEEEKANNLLSYIPELNSPEIKGGIERTNEELSAFMKSNQNYIEHIGDGNPTKKTTFIKSNYSDIVGIKVEKIFNDESGGYIVSGDRVKVSVKVKNIGTKILKKIAYIDSIPNIFVLEKKSVEIKTTSAISQRPPSGYDILINNFSLAPNQELLFSYYINTLPIKHSFLQVGLFEDGEIGDDLYGDIILKKDETNCGENTRIYRSQTARTYLEGIKIPVCDSGKIKLPDALEKNTIDNNGNGIPDYIDILKSDKNAMLKYSKDELSKYNKDNDGDGIPNEEDISPDYNNDSSSLINSLDNINYISSKVSEQVDTFIDGLGCGFGGGGCFSLPMNWAPLAPGNDLVVLGKLRGDGLNVGEGLPVFSALSESIPYVWPPNPSGAGGWLGVDNNANFFRFFITPTLTGAIGIAMCFGPPKKQIEIEIEIDLGNGKKKKEKKGIEVFGCLPPPGKGLKSDCKTADIGAPLIPYGNCIVAAKPLDMCSSDGSDGDPGSIGQAQSVGSDFGIVNGNCSYQENKTSNKTFDKKFIENYLDYKKSGIKSSGLSDQYDTAINNFISETSPGGNSFFSIDGGSSGLNTEIGVEIDTDSIMDSNFSDIIKIKMERTWGFPDFLMSWITRQLEEIQTKLTDWPTLTIILPDFTGLSDGWGDNFLGGLEQSYEKGKNERINEESKIQGKIDSLENNLSGLDCSGEDFGKCLSLKTDITKNKLSKDGGISFGGIDSKVSSMKKGASGIEAVYKFLSNTPLIDIEQEIVDINIPWPEGFDIEKTLLDWSLTKKQWENEIENTIGEWSLGQVCTQTDIEEKKRCEKQNSINAKAYLDVNNLLYSLERNIEILESYKNFPKDLYKVIKTKEFYLEQILCNLDSISFLVGGRIGDNGKRFKSWIQLYITIKAILKSWQLLADIFIDYDAECHQCKNERDDSLYSQFKVISLIIPDIPIIEFPKWPNITMDLHNIRVNLKVYLPDFRFNLRPIVLPQLPNLYLPILPDIGLSFPELPLLPEMILPELPELPSLPTVELPNLPPAPTLPELFSSLEAILQIIKLLVKILCILKTSPLVPEWRAGDQIAFITERQGYLGLDFLNFSLPNFSFPFIDAVKVSSFVNLEFETEFIVEMARQSLSPLNTITNNVSNIFDVQFDNLDFSGYVPSEINTLDSIEIGLNEKINNTVNKNFFAIYVTKRIVQLFSYIEERKNVQIDSSSFISLVNKNLSSHSVVSNPRYNELRKLWNNVSKRTYSKEDKLIKKLQETNTEKFNAVKDIIKKEIQLNKELWKKIDSKNTNLLTKINSENKNNIEGYNKTLDKYNAKFIKSAINLIYGKDEKEIQLEKQGEKIVQKMKTGIDNFSKQYLTNKKDIISYSNTKKSNNILSVLNSTSSKVPAQTSCQVQSNSPYKRKYKGLYVIEGGKNYNLLDYTDILNGKEKTVIIDFDKDGDDDLLYMTSSQLYIKENLKKDKKKIYIKDSPITIKSDKNKFYNGEIFYESINHFNQLGVTNNSIDVSFNGSTNKSINNYRIEFYSIIDKWLNINNNSYSPKNIKKTIIDAFSDIENITLVMEEVNNHTIRNNLAYINYVGKIPGVELKTKKLINIKKEVNNLSIVNISSNTKIYSGQSGFSIEYILGDDDVSKSKYIDKNQNISFNDNIKIVGISGNAYIEGLEDISLIGLNIKRYSGLPLLAGAEIKILDNNIKKNESSHIDIIYYDKSEINIDLREVSNYYLYNLGNKDNDYNIRTRIKNDFYYGKIVSFKENIFSTSSRNILSSPQKESDLIAPTNSIRKIEIPIFQKKEIDLTKYINEEGGISDIKDIYIDFDLKRDNSGDGKLKNDRDSTDTKYKVSFLRNEKEIKILFGPYDKLVKQRIGITLIDENNNIGYKEVRFEVLAPSLSIKSYNNNLIKGVVDNKNNGLPINFYRFRGGMISSLKNKSLDNKTYSFDGGKFSFKLPYYQKGLKLEKSGDIIANINEYTGKIIKKDSSIKINVYPSNSSENNLKYPKIEIQKLGETIFNQYIHLINNPFINIIDDFNILNKLDYKGIYINFIDKESYNYYKIPDGVLYNPGTIVIYRNSDKFKKPLFTIFKDGRINTLNKNYELIYDNHNSFIKFKLKDKHFNLIIAEVLFFVDGGYVIK